MTDDKTPQAPDALAVFVDTGSTPDCFELHERGIVRQQDGERYYTAFADISDLYLSAPGPQAGPDGIDRFAYRSRAEPGWTLVPGDIAEFPRFMDAFRSRLVDQRLPVLEARLADGAKVAFRTLDGGDFPDLTTRELALSAEGLHIGADTWPYESLQRIDLNDWTETVSLRTDDGATVFSCPAARILSSDLFVNLVYDRLGETAQAASA